jgi:signal transduction histidine kinase
VTATVVAVAGWATASVRTLDRSRHGLELVAAASAVSAAAGVVALAGGASAFPVDGPVAGLVGVAWVVVAGGVGWCVLGFAGPGRVARLARHGVAVATVAMSVVAATAGLAQARAFAPPLVTLTPSAVDALDAAIVVIRPAWALLIAAAPFVVLVDPRPSPNERETAGIVAASIVCILPWLPVAFGTERFPWFEAVAAIVAGAMVVVIAVREHADRRAAGVASTTLASAVAAAAGVGVAWPLSRSRLDGHVAPVLAVVVTSAVAAISWGWARRVVARTAHGRVSRPGPLRTELTEVAGSAALPLEAIARLVLERTGASHVRLATSSAQRPVELVDVGEPTSSAAVRRELVSMNETIGVLEVTPRDPALAGDVHRLLDELGDVIAMLLEAVTARRLADEARQAVVDAREDERRRLRRDLHDGLGPALAGIRLVVDAARVQIGHDPGGAARLLDALATEVSGTTDEVRRIVRNLRPPELDELGLVGALEQWAAQQVALGPLRIDVRGPRDPGLPATVESAAFRIAMEALTNVVRHSDARRCCVTIQVDDRLRLEVTDDGVGVGTAARGVGITSMHERAVELGGAVTVGARLDLRPGTTVRTVLPLTRALDERRRS